MIEQLKWEPLFVMRLTVGYDRAQPIGKTASGIRGVYPVDGGTFDGARLRGKINPGGADWVTMRTDGMMLIDVRLSLQTDDGATIGMIYAGLARPTDPANYERFLSREVLPYEDLYLHTTPRFETGDPRYAWLNGVIAVTNGRRVPGGGEYHVFEINRLRAGGVGDEQSYPSIAELWRSLMRHVLKDGQMCACYHGGGFFSERERNYLIHGSVDDLRRQLQIGEARAQVLRRQPDHEVSRDCAIVHPALERGCRFGTNACFVEMVRITHGARGGDLPFDERRGIDETLGIELRQPFGSRCAADAAAEGHRERHRGEARGLAERQQLRNECPQRASEQMRARRARRIQYGKRVVGQITGIIGQDGGVAVGDRCRRCRRAGSSEPRRYARIALVETDDAKAVVDQIRAEAFGPVGRLFARAVQQQNGGIARLAESLKEEPDAAAFRKGHG